MSTPTPEAPAESKPPSKLEELQVSHYNLAIRWGAIQVYKTNSEEEVKTLMEELTQLDPDKLPTEKVAKLGLIRAECLRLQKEMETIEHAMMKIGNRISNLPEVKTTINQINPNELETKKEEVA